MRTDLVGGEDILAKVESFREQHEQAQVGREAATEALRQAQWDDVTAGAAALRDGRGQPKPKAPAAEKVLADANRHFEIVTLALQGEREALAADFASRSDEIRANLAKAEDDIDESVLEILVQLEDLLHERAEVKAHVHWLDDTSRSVGRYNVSGIDALAALRTQLGDEPGKASSKYQEKLDHERRVEEWNALVQRAKATVPASQLIPVLDAYNDSGKSYLALDAAIEREIERMEEAGEEVPVPVVKKWMQRLGTTAKPKGQGTGWAATGKPTLTDMPPDTESTEQRHRDLVRTPPAVAAKP